MILGENFWTLFTPGIWTLLHAVLQPDGLTFAVLAGGVPVGWDSQTAHFRRERPQSRTHPED